MTDDMTAIGAERSADADGQPDADGSGNPGGVTLERLLAELPPTIADVARGATWDVVAVEATGATVWRLDRAGRASLFLKVAPEEGGGAALLRDEADRLTWLGRLLDERSARLPDTGAGITVPSLVASVSDDASGEHYLVTTEVAGTPAIRSEARADADTLIVALASGLRALHELPVEVGSYEHPIEDRIDRARRRVDEGLVDPRQFEPIHAPYAPDQLFEHLLTLQPAGPDDRVVVHGDPSLDNTLLDRGRVAGYVDVGRAGVSDRYLDLAIVARELATRVSPHALGPFFAAYGIDAPDVRKLDFYLMLDEFF